MEDGDGQGKGGARRTRPRRTRTGAADNAAAHKDGRGGQGRAGAASKDKATRAAAGEDRRMGTGWVVARTGGKEKDRQPRLKSPPLLKPPCGRQTRAVVRQRLLLAHH